QISDLVIDQSLTLYHPDGQRRVSGGEQRMLFKLPQRQRVEQTVEGQREIQLTVGDRVWVRRADGRVSQASATEQARALTHVLIPVKRRAADLLAEWRARGRPGAGRPAPRAGGGAGGGPRARPRGREVPP